MQKNGIILLLITLCINLHAQKENINLLKGKEEFKKQSSSDTANYTQAYNLLSKAVKLFPNDAEARYFLGYTIDRLNSFDGRTLNTAKLKKTIEASEQFEKLNSIQSVYHGEIYLLDPYSKITSIWGSQALTYLSEDKRDSALWAFSQGKLRGGFINPILNFNRQLLNSCSKNSILVTSGDYITIPIWYLQLVENCRQDITIIDASLLNTIWYPKFLKSNARLKLSFDDKRLDSIEYIEWNPQKITISNPLNLKEEVTWMLNPTYFNYLLRGDQIFLQILKDNLYEREIYFSLAPDTSYNLFLNNYLINDGIVTKLLIEQNNLEIKPTIISQNFDKYNMNGIDKSELNKSKDAIALFNYFRYTMLNDINFLKSKGETQKAKSLLSDMNLKFPISTFPYDNPELKEIVRQLEQKLQ